MTRDRAFALAYGVDPYTARNYLNEGERYPQAWDLIRAAEKLGPIRAYYSKQQATWLLDQRPATPQQIMREASR